MCLISQTADLGAQERGLRGGRAAGEVSVAGQREEGVRARAFPRLLHLRKTLLGYWLIYPDIHYEAKQ